LRLLSEVGAAFAESLDYEATLAKAARIVVPVFADWCLVDVVSSNGEIKRVAAAARADADERATETLARWGIRAPDEPHPLSRIVRGRSAVLCGDLGADLACIEPGGAAEAVRLVDAGVGSMMFAPLVARDRVLGVLTFALRHERRPYGPSELRTAEQLAYRAALSIDNARLFREAQEKSERAEEASRAKDEFLALLGHELRNPLAPIVTALEILRMRGDVGRSKEQAIIDRQVKHLVTLVDDLLDVSRITSGRIQLRRRRLRVRDVVGKAIEMATPLVEQRRHTMVVSVAEELFVDADEQRLAQVFANLLTNAAKYTDPGGRIEVGSVRSDDGVLTWVRDDGRGIAASLLPRIFDPFVQGKRTVDRAEGGLGLGLAIVRSLVDLHGGKVAVQSDGLGRGSQFSVWLPSMLPGTIDETTGLHRLPKSTGGARAQRILIVDDNEDLVELLADYLMAHGYEVRTAHDGARALAVASEFKPAVAIVDIGLPVLDGCEVARKLRASLSPPPSLVAMTGYGQLADRTATAAAGFQRHLTKPVEPAVVAAAITQLLEGSA
jgi:signal transduction histidine kinase